MSYDADMSDAAIWHQQAMLKIKIGALPGRAVEGLLHEIPVLGMKSLQYPFQCRLDRSIVCKDLVGFLRPVDFSARNIPAEASGRADALPFSQESFAALQIGIQAGILQRDRGLRSQQFQHRDAAWREGARRQIVLEIERANKLRLFDDGHA